jgi:transposase-like protein
MIFFLTLLGKESTAAKNIGRQRAPYIFSLRRSPNLIDSWETVKPQFCKGCVHFVYQAVSKDEAEHLLQELEEKWGKKYPVVLDSWKRNWEKLTTYFQYSGAIRKLIYTTNTIEGFHRQVRKVTKTKGAFTSHMALLKLIYLATQNIQKKWTQPLQNWGLTVSQLSIRFGDRLRLRMG